MPMNVKKMKGNNNKDFKRPDPLEDGTYAGRVVQIIDLGLQPQREYQGQTKSPKYEVYMTYELVEEFMKDDDGNDLEDKPRWISERIPLSSIDNDKAKSTKRYNALDPNMDHDGDFSALIAAPAEITVGTQAGKGRHEGKVFENVVNVSPMRAKKAAGLPELVNEPKVFVLDNPDMEVFEKLPDFLKTIITSNLEFSGSRLEALLKGEKPSGKGKAKGKAEKPVESDTERTEGSEDNEDDLPW